MYLHKSMEFGNVWINLWNSGDVQPYIKHFFIHNFIKFDDLIDSKYSCLKSFKNKLIIKEMGIDHIMTETDFI